MFKAIITTKRHVLGINLFWLHGSFIKQQVMWCTGKFLRMVRL